MSAKFYKYAPNVWLAQTSQECKRGDIITLTTKHGKDIEVEIYNYIDTKNGENLYSFVRLDDESYAERKARKYRESQAIHEQKAHKWAEKSQEGREFLSLCEPIKIGHHSEKRHRALIERNWNRVCNSLKENKITQEKAEKADYWEQKATEINLSMPESVIYFEAELQKAIQRQQGLKNGTIPREHSYSLTYATKAVKDLAKKVEFAKKMWA